VLVPLVPVLLLLVSHLPHRRRFQVQQLLTLKGAQQLPEEPQPMLLTPLQPPQPPLVVLLAPPPPSVTTYKPSLVLSAALPHLSSRTTPLISPSPLTAPLS